MSTQAQILFPCEPQELLEKIRQLVRSELERAKKQDQDAAVSHTVRGMTKKPLFKAHEVCALFSISRPTLYSWIDQGLLKPYKIKSRLFFLASDIEKLVALDGKK